jgi:cellulose synthase/poly-beta-1,6-N-acetylglucosamine synthase-like glycosyltransferase
MHYVFFGIIIILLSKIINKSHRTAEITPTVSFIVAAFNEEKIIRQKINNDLNLDYPKENLEIIIVSDGSSDSTPDIVKEFQDYGVISLHQSKREGKTAALNRAVLSAKNDILIFSDANSMFRKDAIKKLVRHFADNQIGGVCGRKSVLSNSKRKASDGDSLFWKYESALKQAESHLGSIPTADGEIFALKKNHYKSINPQIINDDMAITLNILNQNKRVIYDHEAITEEEASITFKDDFNVKSRMVYGGIQILSLYKNRLNPFSSLFALQFFFHKTLRYFMWLLLVLIFILTLSCFNQNIFFKVFLGAQMSFYLLALMGKSLERTDHHFKIFYFPYYYCNVNIAAFTGFLFFLKQQSTVEIWKKAKR